MKKIKQERQILKALNSGRMEYTSYRKKIRKKESVSVNKLKRFESAPENESNGFVHKTYKQKQYDLNKEIKVIHQENLPERTKLNPHAKPFFPTRTLRIDFEILGRLTKL